MVGIALEAGREVLEVHAAGAQAESKSDGSPVTEADRRAEAVILRGLYEIAPAVPVVAEEQVAAGHAPATGAEFFLVDPLDGTKEFLRGPDSRGEFTVNIGLVRDGAPIAGVVYAPLLEKIWAARPGEAWVADTRKEDGAAGPARPIQVRKTPAEGVVAIASRSHGSPETASYLSNYDIAELRAAGSSLKFCVIAEGEADLYPRFGRTMEWDTAAGDAVLRAAGGRTVTLDGAPLKYGKRNTPTGEFANPNFIALGSIEFRSPAPAPA
jgi:3'(2'),5'-bisphosphate nucleotidase